MNLQFTEPKKTDNGTWFQEADPTDEFWRVWRYSKRTLNNQGIFLFSYFDDLGTKHWKIRRILQSVEGTDKLKNKVVPPYPLKYHSILKDYQREAVSALCASMISNRVSLDASETGTGKTYMNLAVARELELRPGIICTKTGIEDWKIVCKLFRISPLFICNWEAVRSKNFPYIRKWQDQFSGAYNFKWIIPENAQIVLIFDEVHKAGGNDTQNQKLLLAARDYKLLLLSATIADRLSKFRALGTIIGLFEFDDFENWLSKNGCFQDGHSNWQSLSEKDDMVRISKHIFPNFGARLKKNEIPGFPEVQNIAKLFELPNSNRIQSAFKKLLHQIEALKGQNGAYNAALVLQLRYRQFAELQKVPVLIEIIKEYQENGYSIAVFVNFKETLFELQKYFDTNCVVHGGQVGKKGSEERRNSIDSFMQDRERLIICNIAAGGVGISLHDLNGKYPRVAVICPTWSAIQLVQVLGRIHRTGAKSKAINLLVYGARTIEEKVFEKVNAKMENINALNDGDLAETDIFERLAV